MFDNLSDTFSPSDPDFRDSFCAAPPPAQFRGGFFDNISWAFLAKLSGPHVRPCFRRVGAIQSNLAHLGAHRIRAFLSEHLGALAIGCRLRPLASFVGSADSRSCFGRQRETKLFKPRSGLPHLFPCFFRSRRVVTVASKRHVVSAGHESSVRSDQVSLPRFRVLLSGYLAKFFYRELSFAVLPNCAMDNGVRIASGTVCCPPPCQGVLGISYVRFAIEAVGDFVEPPYSHAGSVA